MTHDNDLLKDADIQKIADKGARIYDRIKIKYEPHDNGKFLAIDVDSEKEYLGNTSAEALTLARAKHPNKVFYVVKIGFNVVETMAKSFLEKH
jgi:hypothetical protein